MMKHSKGMFSDMNEKQFRQTFRFAGRCADLLRAGKYKVLAQLMVNHVEGYTLESALEKIKADRISIRHRMHVGGQGGGNEPPSRWAHCECGWSGKDVLNSVKTFKEMSDTVCPIMKAECEKYRLSVAAVLST
jgi:hypothetical protein